jgi:hypothetical protein
MISGQCRCASFSLPFPSLRSVRTRRKNLNHPLHHPTCPTSSLSRLDGNVPGLGDLLPTPGLPSSPSCPGLPGGGVPRLDNGGVGVPIAPREIKPFSLSLSSSSPLHHLNGMYITLRQPDDLDAATLEACLSALIRSSLRLSKFARYLS